MTANLHCLAHNRCVWGFPMDQRKRPYNCAIPAGFCVQRTLNSSAIPALRGGGAIDSIGVPESENDVQLRSLLPFRSVIDLLSKLLQVRPEIGLGAEHHTRADGMTFGSGSRPVIARRHTLHHALLAKAQEGPPWAALLPSRITLRKGANRLIPCGRRCGSRTSLVQVDCHLRCPAEYGHPTPEQWPPYSGSAAIIRRP